MNPTTLREKLVEIGEGNFEQGVEKVYESFIGKRRKIGVTSRFRDSFRTFGVLFNHNLVSSWGDFKDVMNYLVENPIQYSSDTTRVRFDVKPTQQIGLEGYKVSRRSLPIKPYVY